MKSKERFLILISFFFSLSVISQTSQLDPIIDTSANYTGDVSYNTGEVYVIFTIQNDFIVSKDPQEIVNDIIEESTTDKSITIYPNPVTNILTITTSDKKRIDKITIFSMDGRIILNQEIQNNQVDLTNLPVGSYILKTDYSESINFKLIKL